MDIFRVPGAGLTSASDRDTFGETLVRQYIDCTNLLIHRI